MAPKGSVNCTTPSAKEARAETINMKIQPLGPPGDFREAAATLEYMVWAGEASAPEDLSAPPSAIAEGPLTGWQGRR